MNWTFSRKMIGMGLMVVLGLGALMGATFWSFRTLGEAVNANARVIDRNERNLQDNDAQSRQLRLVEDVRTDLVELQLLATQALLAGAKGKVDEKLLASASDRTAALRRHLDALVAASSGTEREAAHDLRQSAHAMIEAVDADLVDLVKKSVSKAVNIDAEFAEFGDELGRTGDKIDTLLDGMQRNVRERLRARRREWHAIRAKRRALLETLSRAPAQHGGLPHTYGGQTGADDERAAPRCRNVLTVPPNEQPTGGKQESIVETTDDEPRTKMEQAGERIRELEAELAASIQTLKALEQESARALAAARETFKKENDRLALELERALDQFLVARQMNQELTIENERLATELEDALDRVVALETQRSQAFAMREDAQKRIATLTEENETLAAELSGTLDALLALQQKAASAQKTTADVTDELDETLDELLLAQKRISALQAKNGTLAAELAGTLDDVLALQKRAAAAEAIRARAAALKELAVRERALAHRVGCLEQETALLSNLRIQLREVLIAAMAAIASKNEGRIRPARIKTIREGMRNLEDCGEMLLATAREAEEKTAAEGLYQNMASLTRAIDGRLRRLIESSVLERQTIERRFAELKVTLNDHYDAAQQRLRAMTTSTQARLERAETEFRAGNEKLRESGDNMRRRLGLAGLIAWIVFGVSVVGVGVLFFLFARGILKPLFRAVGLADAVRAGDLSQRLEMNGGDEISRLAGALNAMADSLQAKAAVAETIARGDFTRTVAPASENDALARSLQAMVGNLNSVLVQVSHAADQVYQNAEKMTASSEQLNHDAATQSSSLAQISSSMSQISAQSRSNAENAVKANRLAESARNSADRGNEQMRAMIGAMADISSSSSEIRKLIKVIDDIAFQTNLLALNAAVEAARAGRHGKGFAVVAEDVRNLAARSAKAARETTDLIENSSRNVENGTGIANETADALGEIVDNVGQVNDLVAEIATASGEQAEGVAQINQGISQIDEVTQRNAANAQEVSGVAEKLRQQAQYLRQNLGRFRLRREAQDAAHAGGFLAMRNSPDGYVSPPQIPQPALPHQPPALEGGNGKQTKRRNVAELAGWGQGATRISSLPLSAKEPAIRFERD